MAANVKINTIYKAPKRTKKISVKNRRNDNKYLITKKLYVIFNH